MRQNPKPLSSHPVVEMQQLEGRRLLHGLHDESLHLTGSNHEELPQKPKLFYPADPTAGARIRGTSWLDENGNGKKDGGEAGLFNQRIYIDANENGKFDSGEQHTFTEVDGTYLFAGLAPGRYVVRQEVWRRLAQSAPSGKLYEIELDADELVRNRNFGFYVKSPITIDVMLVYTGRAARQAGGVEAMEARLVDALGIANAIFVNSQVNTQYRLVLMKKVDYNETNDFGVDLDRLATDRDGLMDEVHGLRNQYGADMVVMATRDGGGGLARHLALAPELGFAVFEQEYAGEPYYVMAHEMGHLLGMAHERAAPVPSDGEAIYPYAFGRKVRINGILFGDVMSYEPGITLPLFSNPGVEVLGHPMGYMDFNGYDPLRDPDEPDNILGLADAARAIHKTARVVAKYKPTVFYGTDTVGDTRGGAMIAGQLPVDQTFRFREQIGERDLSDFFRFTVDERVNFKARLSGMRAGAGLQLVGAGIRPITSSDRSGRAAKTVRAELRPGTYYVRVSSNARNATPYKLTLRAKDVAGSGVASAHAGAFATQSRSGSVLPRASDEQDVLTLLYEFKDLI